MPTKGRQRSASKQTPHSQEQVKDILGQLEASMPEVKIMQFPPRRDRERMISELFIELVISEVLRSFGVDMKKVPKRRKKKRA
ncbi:MAG TPA: hypothetical protein VKB02_06615 [Pyrinomonadaceae bacterium]|nr:hypothetical protein [Pyrinomonadaceae bacterium]